MKFSVATMITLATVATAAPTFWPFTSTQNTQYSSGSQGSSQNTGTSSQSGQYTQYTAHCDTGSVQVNVNTALTMGLFSFLSLGQTILGLVSQCNNQILQLQSQDATHQREVFTQNLVAHMRQQYPSHSVVVAPHSSYSFDSTPIQKTTVQCSTTSGASNYDVIVFDKGNFNLHGNGGFQNWAYVPNSNCQCGGNTVNCS